MGPVFELIKGFCNKLTVATSDVARVIIVKKTATASKRQKLQYVAKDVRNIGPS